MCITFYPYHPHIKLQPELKVIISTLFNNNKQENTILIQYLKVKGRAAEYGERWEHRSQEILAENRPARKSECKNRSDRKFGRKNPGSHKTHL